MPFEIHNANCLDVLRQMPDNSVDSIVTDPPYGLSFMGKTWDYDVPSVEIWVECLRVLKPGGHLLAFAGTRTQHRMAVRIEDAGFEIRDMIAWVYGSGFPKSLDVSKAIDKVDATEARRQRQLRFTEWMRGTGLTGAQIDAITGTNMGGHYTTAASQPAVATREYFEMLRPHIASEVPAWVEQLVDERTVESENFKRREVVGVDVRFNEASGIVSAGRDERELVERKITVAHTEAARQWEGWGTALKPALEPITVARKPLAGTVAANVLAHGTGALNIDGGRIPGEPWAAHAATGLSSVKFLGGSDAPVIEQPHGAGRWPANLIHDGSEEALALFPAKAGAAAPVKGTEASRASDGNITGERQRVAGAFHGDAGSAARFFYCAKASKKDRDEGLEEAEDRILARSCQAQAEAARGNVVDSAAGAFNKARVRKNNHPTVKPTDLMRYLCRLVTPPGGTVLDPFTGSGSTGKAAILEGFRFIGCEMSEEYAAVATARVSAAYDDWICSL